MFLVQFQPTKSNLCCLGVQLVECMNQIGELDRFDHFLGMDSSSLLMDSPSLMARQHQIRFFSFYCRYNKKTSLGSDTTVGFLSILTLLSVHATLNTLDLCFLYYTCKYEHPRYYPNLAYKTMNITR